MAAENIGTLVPTKVPGYSDTADIQAALRLYHYGSYDFDISETDPTQLIEGSVAYAINSLQEDVAGLLGGDSISSAVFNAKGDIISASAADTLEILSVGTNGKVLTANSSTASGLEWKTPEVTLVNSVTLYGKTLESPTLNTPQIIGSDLEIMMLMGALY